MEYMQGDHYGGYDEQGGVPLLSPSDIVLGRVLSRAISHADACTISPPDAPVGVHSDSPALVAKGAVFAR